MLDQLARQLGDLAIAVRPAGLESWAWSPRLEQARRGMGGLHLLKLDFHQRGLQRGRLSPAIEDAAYRIALEALTNISKHAGAKPASSAPSSAVSTPSTLSSKTTANGFDVEAFRLAGAGYHLGMVGMEERAELLDSKFTIESRPGGGGTTLFVRIPLPGGTVPDSPPA